MREATHGSPSKATCGTVRNVPWLDLPSESEKKFAKPLDKQLNRCYNKSVLRDKREKKEVMIMMKFTKKIALEVAINAIENATLPEWSYSEGEDTFTVTKAEAIEKLQKMIEQLDAKASAPKKPTKVQEANEGVKEVIKAVLDGQNPMTVSEIMTHSAELGTLSNQKVASLVRQMVEAGVLVRTEEKRKAYFALAR